MRKQTKLVAVLSAAALLAIGASMTSYAAGGWVAEGDNDWVYLDSDGERVTNEWKRSGDNYYYLDEDGLMAKNALIHDDDADAIYYVNENGTKVMNDWVCIENPRMSSQEIWRRLQAFCIITLVLQERLIELLMEQLRK